MTRDEALAKIVKLRNQAKGNSSTSEAANALKIASELMAKYRITEEDLAGDRKTVAFDELLAELDTYSRSRELPPSVAEAISMLKKNMSPAEKANALQKIVGIARVGAFFMGSKTLGPVKEIIERTLRRHEIVL